MIRWNPFFFLGPAARNVEKRRGTAACCRLGWQIFRTAEVQTSTLVCAGITFEICFGRLWPAMDLGISGIISPQKCIKWTPKSTQDTAIAVHPKVGIGWTVCHWQDMDIFIHIYTSIYIYNCINICITLHHPILVWANHTPGRLLPEPRRGKDLGGMRSQVHLFGQHLAHQPRQAGTPVTPGHPKKTQKNNVKKNRWFSEVF